MVKNCSIKNCKSEWSHKCGISYHRFPIKNERLMKLWLHAVPNRLLPKLITTHSLICSKHFDVDSFKSPTLGAILRNDLKNCAVPSLFEDDIKNLGHKKVTQLESIINQKFSEIVKSGNLNSIGNDESRNVLPVFQKELSKDVVLCGREYLPEPENVIERIEHFDIEWPKVVELTDVSTNITSCYGFSSKCRLCLNSEGKMYPIHKLKLVSSQDVSISFSNIMRRYVPFQICVNDSKPQKICDSCVLFLCQSHNFFDMCIRNNKKLDNMMFHSHNNKVSESTDDYIRNFGNEGFVNENSSPKVEKLLYDVKLDKIKSSETGNCDLSEQACTASTYPPKTDINCAQDLSVPSLGTIIIKHDIDDTIHTATEVMEKSSSCSVNNRKLKEERDSNEEFNNSSETDCTIAYELPIKREDSKESRKLSTTKTSIKQRADRMFGRIMQRKVKVVSNHPPSKARCLICNTNIDHFDDVIAHYETSHLDNQMCILCGKSYSGASLKWMKSHLRRHRNKELWCDSCNIFFVSVAEKVDHLKSGHKDPFICVVCDRRFKSRYKRRVHMTSHTKTKSHTCSICGKSFAYSNNLERHVFVQHKGRRFLCPDCNLPFTNVLSVKFHAYKRHGKELSDYPNYRKVEYIGPDPSVQVKRGRKLYAQVSQNLVCKFCARQCQSKSLYLSHMKIKHKSWPCKLCDNVFDNKKTLQDHVNKDHGKYRCEFCDHGFPYPSMLRHHVVSVHGQVEYGFTCEICGKSLKTKQILDKHLLIHTGERPHICEVCGKTFIQAAHVKVHMYQHTEKPLQCQYCSKRYIFRTDLEAHIRTHTGEKPYECSKCGKTFHNRINMQRHCLLHSGIRRQSKIKVEITTTGVTTTNVEATFREPKKEVIQESIKDAYDMSENEYYSESESNLPMV